MPYWGPKLFLKAYKRLGGLLIWLGFFVPPNCIFLTLLINQLGKPSPEPVGHNRVASLSVMVDRQLENAVSFKTIGKLINSCK